MKEIDEVAKILNIKDINIECPDWIGLDRLSDIECEKSGDCKKCWNMALLKYRQNKDLIIRKYEVNNIVELIDKDYIDCCEWMKVGDRYVITDICKDGRVYLKGLFRHEYTTVLDLEKSFIIYDRD